MKSFSLEGETALITGGGSGLGLGIAECFVEAGARVVLVGRREHVLKDAAMKLNDLSRVRDYPSLAVSQKQKASGADLRNRKRNPERVSARGNSGLRASYEVQDITQVDEAVNLVQRATQHAGPISILVNNAGVHLMKPAVETEVAEFNTVLQTHVVAAFALTRAVLPGMIERKHGNVLFIASMASLFGIPKVIAYSAAKSAYLGIVRTLATEVSPHGVRVNAIAPGWIESDMMLKALTQDQERKTKILDRTPMNGFGKPRDIGLAATYLASPAARFVTGVVLPVDGGASIGF